jgi:hypothetical protein
VPVKAWAWGAGVEVGGCEAKRTDEEIEEKKTRNRKERREEKEEDDGQR